MTSLDDCPHARAQGFAADACEAFDAVSQKEIALLETLTGPDSGLSPDHQQRALRILNDFRKAVSINREIETKIGALLNLRNAIVTAFRKLERETA